MDDAVRAYIEAIDPKHRPLFDRVHELILADRPEVTVGISYGIPTYTAGDRRLHVGAWRHGISLYGWRHGTVSDFLERHPSLGSGRSTIRLRPGGADQVSDDELRALIRGALAG